MAVSVHDIAALIIEEQHAAGRSIDKMQLQKLLYLVQGANLTFWGEPAFREPLLAYRNGPVVSVVEETYRSATHGRRPLDRPLGGSPSRVSLEVAETVRTVLKHYGTWTATNLERFVKKPGSPWRASRRGLPLRAASRDEITLPAIAAWFDDNGIDPAPPKTEVWEPTDDERLAADERLAKGIAPSLREPAFLTADEETAVRRALERAGRPGPSTS